MGVMRKETPGVDEEGKQSEGQSLLELWLKTQRLCAFLLHFCWSVVDLQCCVSFCYTTQWVSYTCIRVKVAQSCPTLCDPMDYSVHGVLQTRIPEWVVFPFSKGASQPRDQTQTSRTAGGFFTSWGTREAQEYWSEEAYPFFSESSWPRHWTGVSCIADGVFTNWAKREALCTYLF